MAYVVHVPGFPTLIPASQPSSTSTTAAVVDIELARGEPPAVALVVKFEQLQSHNMDWAKMIGPSCLTAAIDGAFVYVQFHSKFPTEFYFLNMAILLAFACFFVGWFIKPKYMAPAEVVVNCGLFFTYTAFFIGITIPVPWSLKMIGWLIYAISLLAVSLSFKTELKECYDKARRLNTTNTGES